MEEIVLIDVDEVLANWGKLFTSIAENEFGIKIIQQPGVWDYYDFPEVIPVKDDIIKHLFGTPGMIRSMEMYDYAKDMVSSLRERYTLIACTDSIHQGPFVTERVEWLMEELAFERGDIIFTKRKYLVNGYMLIDDKPSNIEEWAKHHPNGIGVLWQSPGRDYRFEIDLSINNVIKTSNYNDLIL